MNAIAEVRSFNRFYTRQIGLLNEHLPASDLSLAEARVLYELATGGAQTSADVCRKLEMDKAHVSRIVARFRSRGYVRLREKAENAKHLLVELTSRGQRTFARLDDGTKTQIRRMLGTVRAAERPRLVAAFREIQTVLTRGGKLTTTRNRLPAEKREVKSGAYEWAIWAT